MTDSTMAKIPYTEINPFGDVKTRRSTHKYRVSSAHLILSSGFFRQFLGPDSQFKEATDFREHRALAPFELSIDLDDHNSNTFQLAIRLLHGQPPKESIGEHAAEVKTLYELALLAVNLDCGMAMSTWATMVYLNLKLEDETQFADLDHWLYIAWVLRVSSAFKTLTAFCIKNGAREDTDGPIKVYQDNSKDSKSVEVSLVPGTVKGTSTILI